MKRKIGGVNLKTWLGIFLFFHLFYGLVVFFFRGDIVSHVQLLLEYLHRGNFPFSRIIYNSFIFLIAEFLSLFTNLLPISEMKVTELGMFFKNERPYTLIAFVSYIYASIFVLSLATTFKFVITRKIILKLAGKESIPANFNVIVFLLLFIHPLAMFWKGAMYFGYLPYSSYHNSTIILLIPFSLWVFYLTIEWFDKKTLSKKNAFQIFVYNVISIFIKPSYFFVYSIAFPFVSLVKYRFKAKFFLSCLIVALSSIAMVALYYLVYIFDDNPVNKNSQVSIMPFAVWDWYSKNKILYALLSYVFPLTTLIFCYKSIIKEKMALFVLLSVLISVAIYIIFAEDGPRFSHSNFSWQILVSNYILFITYFSYWLKCRRKLNTRINLLIIVTVAMHVIAGIGYFARMLIYQTLS